MLRVAFIILVIGVAACAGEGVPARSAPAASETSVSSTASSAAEAPGTTSSAPVGPACERFGAPTPSGPLGSSDLTEVSGIAASRNYPGILWVHNDSGGKAQVWAIDTRGEVVATIGVIGAEAVDWEDIALGPGPGGDHLYVGDVGDNTAVRGQVTIYRFAEPDPWSAAEVGAEALNVVYPGGSANVEALLVDPHSGDIFLITKRLTGPGIVLGVPAGAWGDSWVTAEVIGEVGLSPAALSGGPVTAADVSPDGAIVAVRTYGDVWLWSPSPGQDLGSVLTESPCSAPAPPETFGEAIALDDDGYWTVAEGEGATLWRVEGR